MVRIKKVQLILYLVAAISFLIFLLFFFLKEKENINEKTIELSSLTLSSKGDNECDCNCGVIIHKYYVKPIFRFTPKIETEKGVRFSINISLSDIDGAIIYSYQKYDFDEEYDEDLKETVLIDSGYDKNKVRVMIYVPETMETKSLGINAYRKYDNKIDRDKIEVYNEETGKYDKSVTIAEALKMSHSGVLRSKKVKYKDLSNIEKKFVMKKAQEKLNLKIKLFAAGLLVKPEELQTTTIGRDLTWSVMSLSPGIFPVTLQVYGADLNTTKDESIFNEEKLFNIEVIPSSRIAKKESVQYWLAIISCIFTCIPVFIQIFKKK